MVGVPIEKLLTGNIPAPAYWLRWGEDIPAEAMQALRRGEVAMLHDTDGKPYSIVLMDGHGKIREREVEL